MEIVTGEAKIAGWRPVAIYEARKRIAEPAGVSLCPNVLVISVAQSVPCSAFSKIGTGDTRRQCPPDSASANGNPADPAMADTDAEPSCVEVQAHKWHKIYALPDTELNKSDL